jgi:prophage regulatory protein
VRFGSDTSIRLVSICPAWGFGFSAIDQERPLIMIARPEALLRVRHVLQRVPISRSAWWLGVKQGRFPAGIKLSPRVTVWRETDIDALIARFRKP